MTDKPVLIYSNGSNETFHRLAVAFADGAKKNGLQALFRNPSPYRAGCYAAAAAVLVHGTKGPNEAIIADQLAKDGTPVVAELGYLNRGTTPDDYYALGIGGLNAKAFFNNRLSPSDRWDALGIELQPWKTGGKYILIIGQVPNDANLDGVDPYRFAKDMKAEIEQLSELPVLFRPHPMDETFSQERVGMGYTHTTLEEDLADAALVVGYTSNTLVDAAIAGVPVVSYGKSMASPVAYETVHDALEAIELGIPHPDRQQWAHDLAYTQWTLEEIAEGLAWAHLIDRLTPQVEEPAKEPAKGPREPAGAAQPPAKGKDAGGGKKNSGKAK